MARWGVAAVRLRAEPEPEAPPCLLDPSKVGVKALRIEAMVAELIHNFSVQREAGVQQGSST